MSGFDPAREPYLDRPLDGVGGGASLGGIEVDDSCQLLVARLDAGDGHFRNVACRGFARPHGGGNGGRALIQQLGHLFFLIGPLP